MGEVRACVYFSVIFLCFQISAAKPFFFFGERFWCDIFCEDDDGPTTTTGSSDDYYDSWCDDCPTRRPRPATTPMPPAFPYPGMPGPQGIPGSPGFPVMQPGPVNYYLGTPPNGGSISMVPNAGNSWIISFNPVGGPGGSPTPNATPALVSPPTTAAKPPAAAATTAVPAAAAPGAPTTPAAPGAAVTTAAPAAGRK